jgi:hypothetical protein
MLTREQLPDKITIPMFWSRTFLNGKLFELFVRKHMTKGTLGTTRATIQTVSFIQGRLPLSHYCTDSFIEEGLHQLFIATHVFYLSTVRW